MNSISSERILILIELVAIPECMYNRMAVWCRTKEYVGDKTSYIFVEIYF